LGDYKIFGVNKTGKAQDEKGYVAYVTEDEKGYVAYVTEDDKGYVAYVTEALPNMRLASIVTSVLFAIVVIMALMNMLVTLAVRGVEELIEYGQIYHLWNQVQLL
jgi:hypothetical protein